MSLIPTSAMNTIERLIPLPFLKRKPRSAQRSSGSAVATRLLANSRYELVPLKSVDAAIEALPNGATASVTCSPVKGIGATLALTERVVSHGQSAIPHIAARMVEGPDHVATIAAELKRLGVAELFVVGGDQTPPLGPYPDGESFIAELLTHDHGLRTIGFPAYPDGHALIETSAIHAALHAKERLVRGAGLQTFASTQMCFDTDAILTWLRAERAAGLQTPVFLGLPGVVDRTKLITLGARLGIGASMRFLAKNRASVTKLLTSTNYDPMELVGPIAAQADALNIVGLHLFTFNEVAATRDWLNEVSS